MADAQGPPTRGPASEACDEQNGKLQWDYTVARQCGSDTDCNYVTPSFAVVERSAGAGTITSWSCDSVTPPLMVANGSRVASMATQLKQDAADQARACAEPADGGNYPCADGLSMDPSGPPVCGGGVCQVAE